MSLKLFLLSLFLPLLGSAHPGVGIVCDSKGVIYYTDLERVWRIKAGVKTVVVPGVHTHELYIDSRDQLFGEAERYDPGSGKFFHYFWRYRPDGQLDTVMGMRESYLQQDFSLARDGSGAEYYTKAFLGGRDTAHIYKRTQRGIETVYATGNFKGVTWLHPQKDGQILYIHSNTLYRVDTLGRITVIKRGIAGEQPSLSLSGQSVTVWGVWQDRQKAIYVAAFSDGAVKKIDVQGRMSVVYQSERAWAPLHGVFDPDGRLWVLEGSDRNQVRVQLVSLAASPAPTPQHSGFLVASCFVVGIGLGFLIYRKLQ